MSHRSLLLAAGALALVAPTAHAQAFVGSFPFVTPNGIPVGLDAAPGGNLYFTDLPGTIGTADRTGNVLSTIDVSANSSNPIGITTDGAGNFYVTDTSGPDVDVYDSAGNYVSSFDVSTETTFPEGIAWSSVTNNLYVVSGSGNNLVAEYDLSGSAVATYPINGSSPDGIAHDAATDTFWLYDSGTDSLRNYDAAFAELSAVPGTGANGLGTGEGLAFANGLIYICATGSASIGVFDPNAVSARAESYGVGCPEPRTATFYEQFTGTGNNDLSGTAVRLVRNANGGWDVSSSSATYIAPTNALSSGDDQLFQDLALGFTIEVPGVGAVDTVDVDSNGRFGFGLTGSDFSESVGEFIAQNIIAPNWDDLNPAAGGDVYFDVDATRAVISWDAVPQFPSVGSNTFQAQIQSTGEIDLVWVQVADDGIVGASDGTNLDPGSIDLSASVPFSTSLVEPYTIEATPPVIGSVLTITVRNRPVDSTISYLNIGVFRDNIPLDPIGMPGCTLLTNFQDGLPTGFGNLQLQIPNDPFYIGAVLTLQGLSVSPSSNRLGVVASNGIELLFGI